jgi:hypothetical protein
VSFGTSSGDNADDFCGLLIISNGMGNNDQCESVNQSRGLPTLLATDMAILFQEHQWIIKYLYCVFERYAMFPKIALGFLVVPLETQALPPTRNASMYLLGDFHST